ncbi:MAG: hypothetical protein ACXVCY_02305 [Pseudobdellovibrionaceae bacterium]
MKFVHSGFFIFSVILTSIVFNWTLVARAEVDWSEVDLALKSNFLLERAIQRSLQMNWKIELEGPSGKLNLQDLPFEFQKIQILHQRKSLYLAACGQRVGAANIPGKFLVALPDYEPYYGLKPEIQSLWFLHEALEAVGFNDRYGQISLTVGVLAEETTSSDFQQKLALNFSKIIKASSNIKVTPNNTNFCKSNSNLQIAGGGSTGVGEGGDPISFDLKWNSYKILKQISSSDMIDIDLFGELAQFPLEADYSCFGQSSYGLPAFQSHEFKKCLINQVSNLDKLIENGFYIPLLSLIPDAENIRESLIQKLYIQVSEKYRLRLFEKIHQEVLREK